MCLKCWRMSCHLYHSTYVVAPFWSKGDWQEGYVPLPINVKNVEMTTFITCCHLAVQSPNETTNFNCHVSDHSVELLLLLEIEYCCLLSAWQINKAATSHPEYRTSSSFDIREWTLNPKRLYIWRIAGHDSAHPQLYIRIHVVVTPPRWHVLAGYTVGLLSTIVMLARSPRRKPGWPLINHPPRQKAPKGITRSETW